jgi:hypothetical protein
VVVKLSARLHDRLYVGCGNRYYTADKSLKGLYQNSSTLEAFTYTRRAIVHYYLLLEFKARPVSSLWSVVAAAGFFLTMQVVDIILLLEHATTKSFRSSR